MNKRRKFLFASVLGLQNSSFIYPSCQKCFSRIILLPKRYNCPKCGSTGEAENACYRYKLSLKVAETNKLFVITIFGSALDTFFGLTATDLHRYIQNPDKIPETLDSNTTQDLLIRAAETCFVGQRFIFGVTNFEKQCVQGSNSCKFLQQYPEGKREVKALVACQIVLPDPGVAGFTVIDYFRQFLQTSNLKKLHCGSQAPNSHILALDHSNSDLSNIDCSDSTSSFSKSCGRENFSRFCQPSLELISIVSQLTDKDDLLTLDQSKTISSLHQNKKSYAEPSGSNSCHDPTFGSWSLVSYMDKKCAAEKLDEELGSQTNQMNAVHSSQHEIRATDSDISPLKTRVPSESSNTKFFSSSIEIKNSYSQHELPCYQHHNIDTSSSIQEKYTWCPPSSLRLLEDGVDSSQDCDPEIWDDLPFSESLNKFLAVIESEIAVTQTDASSREHHVDNDLDKLHTDCSRLSVTPQRTVGAMCTPPVAKRSSQATVKASSSKDNFLSNCKANPGPSIQNKSQSDNTSEAVSISSNRGDILECFQPNTYLSPLFSSSKNFKTIVTLKETIKIPPHTNEISLKPSASERDHSYFNLKYFNGHGEKSLSKMNEELRTLCSRKYSDFSDLCTLENKQYYRWPKNQGESFTICRKLTYPLETVGSSPDGSTNALKKMPHGHFTNNLPHRYSTGHEGSYNASVDLFDDIAKEMDITTEITKKSQDILLHQGTSFAEKSNPEESDFSLRSLFENSSQSSQKLSLHSVSASRYPRTCSPPPHFQSDSEYDFEDSQDFVPCSQSTPVTGFHQTRIPGINRAFEKLSSFLSDLDDNYKKARISPENGKQQSTPSFPKYVKTSSKKSRSPIIYGITQPEVFNDHPVAECFETDDEWVPPTTKKVFLSDKLGFQVMGLRKCLAAHNSDQEELPRKKLKHVKQGTDADKCLIKKEFKNIFTTIVTKQKTPKYNYKSSGCISKKSVCGFDACSEVKSCLPFSENCLPSVPETETAWSPELFS